MSTRVKAPTKLRVWPGRPYPLGATWDGSGTNFAIYSEHATSVELCLFDRPSMRSENRTASSSSNRPTWSGTPTCPTSCPGSSTATASTVPTIRPKGIASIRNKVLLDPYAKAIARETSWDDAMWGYKVGDPKADLSFDERDNARVCPAGRRGRRGLYLGRRSPAAHALAQDAHLRVARQGLHEAASRGARELARHLRRPRLRAGDSLSARTWASRPSSCCPCTTTLDDRHLVERGLMNYWGYNTLGFFAPEPTLCARPKRPRDVGARVQDDGPQPARRRHRGDSRRGLQPHGRRQPAGPDALVPRHRQRHVLPAVARRSALLHGLHRLRQHVQHAATRACCS